MRQAARGHPPGSSRGGRRRRTSSSELKGSAAASTGFATGGIGVAAQRVRLDNVGFRGRSTPATLRRPPAATRTASGRSAAPGHRTSRWPSVRSLVPTRRGRAVEAGPRLRDGAPALGASAPRSSDGNVVSGLLSPRLVRRLRFTASMTDPSSLLRPGAGSLHRAGEPGPYGGQSERGSCPVEVQNAKPRRNCTTAEASGAVLQQGFPQFLWMTAVLPMS